MNADEAALERLYKDVDGEPVQKVNTSDLVFDPRTRTTNTARAQR